MSKIPPEMPDFLKKEGPNSQDTPPPIPADAMGKSSEKHESNSDRKKHAGIKKKVPLIEFRNEKGEMVPSEATPVVKEKTFNDYFSPLVGQILGICFLLTLGAGLFFYYQAEAYKNKFQAMDSRILSFTKEIANLNKENNSLSGKVVFFQKELEGKSDLKVEELKKQISDLQNQLLVKNQETNSLPSSSVSETKSTGSSQTPVVKKNEAPDPLPQVNNSSVFKSQNIPSPTQLKPQPNMPKSALPDAIKNNAVKASDGSINYEPRLKTPGELACLNYYKKELVKKCQDRNPKYNTVSIFGKSSETGVKLIYQCQGNDKPLSFKYGPMEIYNNCVGR